ncbi:hypothetical protein [Salmonella enterica]|uniref:hypothetical protein n=1 Tax=Salmonella enterica TaxID=28901 RepID=UPI002EAC4E54|nr:hypothetical protein [Salmonella enterica]
MTTNNHPAHGPVSLDRLHQIREILSKAAAQSDGGNLGYAMADAVKVIDEVLERRKTDRAAAAWKKFHSMLSPDDPAAPQPAPVAQCPFPCGWDNLNKLAIQDAAFVSRGLVEGEEVTEAQRQAVIANNDRLLKVISACRAAILQGSQPVSNRDELPLDYLQGHKDGLEWAAQLAEANHPQTGDWLYDDPIELAKAIRNGPDMPEGDSNSPVTPDGSEDTKRLDWLDAQNKRLNEYYGTSYGWKFDANFQRNAMMLNDSNYPVMTVRQAIDEAIAEATKQENI